MIARNILYRLSVLILFWIVGLSMILYYSGSVDLIEMFDKFGDRPVYTLFLLSILFNISTNVDKDNHGIKYVMIYQNKIFEIFILIIVLWLNFLIH